MITTCAIAFAALPLTVTLSLCSIACTIGFVIKMDAALHSSSHFDERGKVTLY
ncbi:hypothetical protein APA_1802 [Pseudanabaena sp. lw0831]|nr:hypothetical protein APA_1802 [Pseudanabaena sp. lw0831]